MWIRDLEKTKTKVAWIGLFGFRLEPISDIDRAAQKIVAHLKSDTIFFVNICALVQVS